MLNKILSALPENFPWRDRVHWFDCVDSTNNLAKLWAADGAPNGTILIADSQTKGRGRRGRSFSSPSGMGIYLSILLRPDCKPEELMHLTCAGAIALCNGIYAHTNISPGIKWTNDLVYENRKLAGILTELSVNAKTGKVEYAIMGLGINCFQSVADFSEEIQSFAGSLKMFSRENVDRFQLCGHIIQKLWDMDCTLLSGKKEIMKQYRSNCITLGKEISLVRGNVTRHGIAIDVDEHGALIVSFPDGTVEAVNSGEVSVRGMYGYV